MSTVSTSFDLATLRAQFPILSQELNGNPLVYFDNAATTQKPTVVINAISDYYNSYNANIHRGLHSLAERATAEYENTRTAVADFINSPTREQIIFTGGTTNGINLVAATYGRMAVSEGDEILVSAMEHHSNIVPWQMLCQERGATLKVLPMSDAGVLDLASLPSLLSSRTKIVAIVYASNSLGTVNQVSEIITQAHKVGAVVLVDAAQAIGHFECDVQALDVDFFVFSAHKLFGPTGLGVLYGRRALLEAMPPWQGGGEMIRDVTFEQTTYNDLPYKFEAGTPNIADVIAFRHSIDFVRTMDRAAARQHEDALLTHATVQVEARIPGLRVIGQAEDKISVLSFVVEGAHHQDIGILLDNYGIAVRTGHHCTQPVMDRLGIPGTTRASFSLYNTIEEVDYFVSKLEKVVSMVR
jgi:cysteine desulfurase / selenocysteine lyase